MRQPSRFARTNIRRDRIRRAVRAAAAGAATAGGFLVSMPRPAAATTASDANAIAYDINAIRAWFHMPALALNPALSSFATAHSQQMAAAGTIFHTSNLYSVAALVPGWREIGENVGMGANEPVVEQALAHSITHLRNMLGAYDQMGVGVVESGGAVFVTEEFAQAPL